LFLLAQIDKKVGKKIRQMRKALGLSQIALAERIGISFQQIQKYEKGASKISVLRLQQISEALDTNINTFFEVKESALQVFGPTLKYDSTANSLHTPSLLNAEETTILKLFRKIKNKKFRESILRQLKGIIELEKK
jgi:transcriptional regulator with XRE-family HTH domain